MVTNHPESEPLNLLNPEAAPGKGNAATENTLENDTGIVDKTTDAVADAYDKAAKPVSETYEKAKSYSYDNPGKTIFIALGIGIGLGILVGASSHHRSRTSRIAEPVVNALSDVALAFLR